MVELEATPAFTPTLTLPRRGGGDLVDPPHKVGAEQYWPSPVERKGAKPRRAKALPLHLGRYTMAVATVSDCCGALPRCCLGLAAADLSAAFAPIWRPERTSAQALTLAKSVGATDDFPI
jgi:hypothetical protein